MAKSNDLNLDERYIELVRKIDSQSTLLRAWTLQGGVSAYVTALEISTSDGQTKRMIVRQHGAGDLQRNPRVAADEFMLLRTLKSEGLPTPTPYLLDESNVTFNSPYIVIEFIDGKTVFAPSNMDDFTAQLATVLSRIHSVDVSKLELSFLPNQEDIYGSMLRNWPDNHDEASDEYPILQVLRSVWPLPPRNKRTLLHGDFWPGNVLWNENQLIAVIDWEDAALGDPLLDIANARLEILWSCGVDAMNSFTHAYQSLSAVDFTNLPYWDLSVALQKVSKVSGWGLDKHIEETMRERCKCFITQALDTLSIH